MELNCLRQSLKIPFSYQKPNITNNSVQKVQGVLSGVVNQQIFDIIEVWDTLSSEVQHTLCQLALKGKGGSYK